MNAKWKWNCIAHLQMALLSSLMLELLLDFWICLSNFSNKTFISWVPEHRFIVSNVIKIIFASDHFFLFFLYFSVSSVFISNIFGTIRIQKRTYFALGSSWTEIKSLLAFHVRYLNLAHMHVLTFEPWSYVRTFFTSCLDLILALSSLFAFRLQILQISFGVNGIKISCKI